MQQSLVSQKTFARGRIRSSEQAEREAILQGKLDEEIEGGKL